MRKTYLTGLLSSMVIAGALTGYTQEKIQSKKNTVQESKLELIVNLSKEDKLSKEECLEIMKEVIWRNHNPKKEYSKEEVKKYWEEILKEPKKKEDWEKYWSNPSKDVILNIIKKYNNKERTESEEKVIDDVFNDNDPEYTSLLLNNFFIWMNPKKLTYPEKIILNEYNHHYKTIIKYLSHKKD